MEGNDVLERIASLFATKGSAEYHGEPVTQLEHALQAATFAERDLRPAAWIVAALLHDIGHLVQMHGQGCAKAGIDDRHEELGLRFLSTHFDRDVTDPIRYHVDAKRYLCSVDAAYALTLTPASLLSLQLQGGPMTAEQAREFGAIDRLESILAIRRYDDLAKVRGCVTPCFEHFAQYLQQCLESTR